MAHTTALVLFESSDQIAVVSNPVNHEWVTVADAVCGVRFDVLARRYYLALQHFRKQEARPTLPGRVAVFAAGKLKALQGMLDVIVDRKAQSKAEAGENTASNTHERTFVDALTQRDVADLPQALKDFSELPPSLYNLCGGPGRPACDALCLMRAFLAAPLLGLGDDPTSVHRLLHSNPSFARVCGFQGRTIMKLAGEMTSRRTPSLAVCEEFDEVMTRYGLWQHARLEQVKDNLASGVIDKDDTMVFDTTHVQANSHCANVVPAEAKAQGDAKPKHRKVPRMRKTCACGKPKWESCDHPWTPTDQGAAVVVKGPTRIYWAHKQSVASLGRSEIPIDVRVLQYAAENDGKTLVPHLQLLAQDLPDLLNDVRYVAADDAYQENRHVVGQFGQRARFIGPVHPSNKSKAKLAATFAGIDRFTPTGVPVCKGDHRFVLIGRDISGESYIWAAPDDTKSDGSVCRTCPLAQNCLSSGHRRHIRVDRQEFPNIDWDHPQHLARNRALYKKRTGVERAIKRLKVDLGAEDLTHRDSHRVQAPRTRSQQHPHRRHGQGPSQHWMRISHMPCEACSIR
jgi:hypothetical protein